MCAGAPPPHTLLGQRRVLSPPGAGVTCGWGYYVGALSEPWSSTRAASMATEPPLQPLFALCIREPVFPRVISFEYIAEWLPSD